MDKEEVKNLLSKVSDDKLINMVLQDRDEYDRSTLAAAIEVLNERDVEINFDRYRGKKSKITVNPEKMNIDKTAEPDNKNDKKPKTSIKNIKVKPQRNETADDLKKQEDLPPEKEKDKSTDEEKTETEIPEKKDKTEIENEKIYKKQDSESSGQLEVDKNEKASKSSVSEKAESKQVKLEFSEQEILEIKKASKKSEDADAADKKAVEHGKISNLISYAKLGGISLFIALSMLLVFSFVALVGANFGFRPVLLIFLFLMFFIVSILGIYKSFYLFSDVNQDYQKINNFLEKNLADNQ